MKLSLEEMVTAVIFGSFLLVIAMSLVSRMLHRRAEIRLERTRSVCRLCGHLFIEPNAGRISHCPSCDALNFDKGNGRLG